MGRAVTIRLDEATYKLLAEKAKSERRSLANFIQIGAIYYAQGALSGDKDSSARKSKALETLAGLWKDHPIKSPDNYIRSLRKGGRLQRLGLT